jgi:hypothetical protein
VHLVGLSQLRDTSCAVHVMRYVLPLFKLKDITSSKRQVTEHIAMSCYS